ncbi:type IV pilin protein [Candidatus Omnitrophota bacterium]
MKKGFTLLELIIVMIIVGVLAFLAIGQYGNIAEKARGAEAKGLLGDLKTQAAIIAYEDGADNIDATNLSLGVSGIPAACRATHWFSYAASGVTASNTGTLVATRCTAAGKDPQYVGVGTITLAINFTSGNSTETIVGPW